MKYFSKILLLVFAFIYIYTPSLIIWPTQIDVLIYIVFALMVVVSKCNPFNALRIEGIKTSVMFMILLVFYSSIWTIVEPPMNIGLTDLSPIRIVRLIIEGVIFSYILVFVAKKNGVTQKQMIYGLIYLAIFQSYISVLMIFIPSVKDFVTTYIIHFGTGNKLLAETLFANRVFGIGSEYLFALPIFQAMMACVYVSVQEKKNIFFYFNLLCLISSAIFCARTSLFVLLGYFIYRCVKNLRKHFFFIIIMAVAVACVLWYALQKLLLVEDIAAVANFVRIFKGEYQGYDMLFDSMLFFPEDIVTWIMGDGTYVFYASRNSDLGYVNDIFYGGLVFLLLEILSLYALYKRVRRTRFLADVFPFLFLILFVIHYKGSIFSANDFMKGIFLLYYIAFSVKDDLFCRLPNKYKGLNRNAEILNYNNYVQ